MLFFICCILDFGQNFCLTEIIFLLKSLLKSLLILLSTRTSQPEEISDSIIILPWEFNTFSSSKLSGSGNWTKIPCIDSSLLSLSITGVLVVPYKFLKTLALL